MSYEFGSYRSKILMELVILSIVGRIVSIYRFSCIHPNFNGVLSLNERISMSASASEFAILFAKVDIPDKI